MKKLTWYEWLILIIAILSLIMNYFQYLSSQEDKFQLTNCFNSKTTIGLDCSASAPGTVGCYSDGGMVVSVSG